MTNYADHWGRFSASVDNSLRVQHNSADHTKAEPSVERHSCCWIERYSKPKQKQKTFGYLEKCSATFDDQVLFDEHAPKTAVTLTASQCKSHDSFSRELSARRHRWKSLCWKRGCPRMHWSTFVLPFAARAWRQKEVKRPFCKLEISSSLNF